MANAEEEKRVRQPPMANFVFEEEEEVPLQEKAQSLEKGDVSLVLRREQQDTWRTALYVRGHLVDLQKELEKFIESGKANRLYVKDPPGCGKTCFLYPWARPLSFLKNKRVLVVQFREKDSCFIWIRDPKGSASFCQRELQSSSTRPVGGKRGCVEKLCEQMVPKYRRRLIQAYVSFQTLFVLAFEPPIFEKGLAFPAGTIWRSLSPVERRALRAVVTARSTERIGKTFMVVYIKEMIRGNFDCFDFFFMRQRKNLWHEAFFVAPLSTK